MDMKAAANPPNREPHLITWELPAKLRSTGTLERGSLENEVGRVTKLLWARQDSNLRPSDYESPALTAAPRAPWFQKLPLTIYQRLVNW